MLFLLFATCALACYGADLSITEDAFGKVFVARCIASNQRAVCEELLTAKKLQETYSAQHIVLIEILLQSITTQLKSHQMRKQIAETIIHYFFRDNEHTNYPTLHLMYNILCDDLKNRDAFECIHNQLKPIFIYAMNEMNNSNGNKIDNRYKLFGLWLLDELLSHHAKDHYLCFNLWSVGVLHLDFIEAFLERRIKITHDSTKFEIITLILADVLDNEFADNGKMHLLEDYRSELCDLKVVFRAAMSLGKKQRNKLINILVALSGNPDKKVIANNPLTPTLKLNRSSSRLLKHFANITTNITNTVTCTECHVNKKITCCNVM